MGKVTPFTLNQSMPIVKRYIERRLPRFDEEINAINALINGKTNANHLIFYDSQESPENFLKKFSNLAEKKKGLEELQDKVQKLKEDIDKSHNPAFLSAAYNKITESNKSRNLSLEKMDDGQTPISWYVPNSLSQNDFEKYAKTLGDLLNGASSPETGAALPPHSVPQKKKGFQQHVLGKVKKRLAKIKI